MDDSSAELPIDQVIVACEKLSEEIRNYAIKEWNRFPPEKKQEWWALGYEGDAEEYGSTMASEKGPTNLYQLCLAAQECGATLVRVSAKDFAAIWYCFSNNTTKSVLAGH